MANKYAKPSGQSDFTRVNHQIKLSPILVIEGDDNLGVMLTKDALQRAKDAGLDLVEVVAHARPPVCKIMDYGKFKYEKSVREKKQHTKQSQLKEMRLSPKIAEHDLETKVRLMRGFLEDGHKVCLKLKFTGAEMAHQNLGLEVINKALEALQDVGIATQKPRLEGRMMMCHLEPGKSKK